MYSWYEIREELCVITAWGGICRAPVAPVVTVAPSSLVRGSIHSAQMAGSGSRMALGVFGRLQTGWPPNVTEC